MSIIDKSTSVIRTTPTRICDIEQAMQWIETRNQIIQSGYDSTKPEEVDFYTKYIESCNEKIRTILQL
jgi:hypothetical protein